MAKYALGGSHFGKKDDIRTHIQQIRATTPLHSEVTDSAVLALLRLHPEWDEKTKHMKYVGTAIVNPVYGAPSKEIAIITEAGGHVDISWRKILERLRPDGTLRPENKARSYFTELELAARQAIAAQIQAVSVPGLEVDHVFPNTFKMILYGWLLQLHKEGFDVTQIEIDDCDKDLVISRRFRDPTLERSWQLYHSSTARLETVSPEEHQKRPVVSVRWPVIAELSEQ